MPAVLTNEKPMIYTVTHEYGRMLKNILIKKELEKAGWDAINFMGWCF